MLLHEEGAQVNKNNPGLLAALEEIYKIIAQHDQENVYNMDETGLFFSCFRDIASLCPTKTSQPPESKRK